MLCDSHAPSGCSEISERAENVVTSVNGRARLVEWFHRWWRPIRNWIAESSAVPPSDAEDLTQDVFLRLLRYSDDVLVRDPQSYLFRVATNVVLEWRSHCRVRLPHDDAWLEDLLVATDEEPSSVLEQTKVSHYLRSAVNKLPVRQREILLMHVNDGLTYKQIAERKGLTYRIVLRDLSKANSTLRCYVVAEDL
jgi:RNA polymerase sigma-70 factor (ECF subfamily)